MPTEIEKAYLAGIVDGEGHIGITLSIARPNGGWHTHYMIVTIANTHIETLTWIQSLWPHGTLVVRKQPKQRIPIGNLRWSSASSVSVLKDVLPYLKIKKGQATLALQFAEEMASRKKTTNHLLLEEWNRREELRLAIRQLNRPNPDLKPEPFPAFRFTKTCQVCGVDLHGGLQRRYCSKSCQYKAKWKRTKTTKATD